MRSAEQEAGQAIWYPQITQISEIQAGLNQVLQDLRPSAKSADKRCFGEPGMKEILKLLNNNREWARRVEIENPGFFTKLKRQQHPKYLWIGQPGAGEPDHGTASR
jgi:hypothetical protein